MKKKIIVIACVVLLSLSLISCAQNKSTIDTSVESELPPESSLEGGFTEEIFSVATSEEQEIIDLYINPYVVTGLYSCSFSADDMNGLDGSVLMNMFEALVYNEGFPEGYPSKEELNESDGQVPANIVDEVLSGHFNLSSDEIRAKLFSDYNAENDTYQTPGGLGGGHKGFIITDHKLDGNILEFSYEYYGPAEIQVDEELHYELFDTGTMVIEIDGESFVFISNFLASAPKTASKTTQETITYDLSKMPQFVNINAAPVEDLTNLYALTGTYVWPLTANGGIWFESWESPSEISAEDLIYTCAFNQWVEYDRSDETVQPFAPAEEVEAAIQKHFDVTTDYLRTSTAYNTENNTYPEIEGGGGWAAVAMSATQEGNQVVVQVGQLPFDETQATEIGFLKLELTDENVVRYLSYECTQEN